VNRLHGLRSHARKALAAGAVVAAPAAVWRTVLARLDARAAERHDEVLTQLTALHQRLDWQTPRTGPDGAPR